MLLEELITHENDFHHIKINQNVFRGLNDEILSQIERNISIFKNFTLNHNQSLKGSSGIPFSLTSFDKKGLKFELIEIDSNNRNLFKCNDFYFKTSVLENNLFFYLLKDGDIYSRFYFNDNFVPFVDFINESDFNLINKIEEFNINIKDLVNPPVERQSLDTEQNTPFFEYESKPFDEQIDFIFDIDSFKCDDDDDDFYVSNFNASNEPLKISTISQFIQVKKHSRFNEIYYLRFVDYKILSLETSILFKKKYEKKTWLYNSAVNEPYKNIIKNMDTSSKAFVLEYTNGLNWTDTRTENQRILEMIQNGLNFLKPYELGEDELEMYQLNYSI